MTWIRVISSAPGMQGAVVAKGALANIQKTGASTTYIKDVGGTVNYVAAALTESVAGKSVSKPVTLPYGCGIKYQGGKFGIKC